MLILIKSLLYLEEILKVFFLSGDKVKEGYGFKSDNYNLI